MIEAVVQRVLDLSARQNHQSMPVRQRVLDALNEKLQDAAPKGRDAQAEIHALAERLDEIVVAACQALGIEPTPEPQPSKPEPELEPEMLLEPGLAQNRNSKPPSFVALGGDQNA